MFGNFERKTCRYCKRSYKQAVGIHFRFPHCSLEKAVLLGKLKPSNIKLKK